MTNELDWDRIFKKAPPIARKIAREYPGIDAEDIQQEIYLWTAENKSSLERGECNDSYLERVLYQAGVKYANAERYTYIHRSSEWIYTPDEIRALMKEAFFDKGMWENMPVKDDSLTITARGVVVSLWDMGNAFDALRHDDQIAIRSRYEFGLPYESDAERKRVNRAIDVMTRKINGQMAEKSEGRTLDSATV